MSEEKSPMVKIGGLWLNTSQSSGEKYFAGYLGSAKLLIFKNKFKEQENHPDYVMYVAPQKKKEESTPAGEVVDADVPF